MAVRTNIGKITAAIESGRRANDAIDRGPIVPIDITTNKESFADWQFIDSPSDIFLAGVHKWGYPTLKVGK